MASGDTPATGAPPEAECYICLRRGTDDNPLRRKCACRGPTAGFAHMECLIKAVHVGSQQKHMLLYECGLCETPYYGDVLVGLARARWERARDRAEDDTERLAAVNQLALAHRELREYDAALPLFEEALRIRRRTKGNEHWDTFTS
eukprot:COSAG04_NODE_15799_length_516_cov_0.600950_1_plen_145_part_10